VFNSGRSQQCSLYWIASRLNAASASRGIDFEQSRDGSATCKTGTPHPSPLPTACGEGEGHGGAQRRPTDFSGPRFSAAGGGGLPGIYPADGRGAFVGESGGGGAGEGAGMVFQECPAMEARWGRGVSAGTARAGRGPPDFPRFAGVVSTCGQVLLPDHEPQQGRRISARGDSMHYFVALLSAGYSAPVDQGLRGGGVAARAGREAAIVPGLVA
jgi:hypothetical protein